MIEQEVGYNVVLSETEGSKSRTPLAQCKKWARECDIYIAILMDRYGWLIPGVGISATETEFREAHKDNPEKILVYLSAAPKEKRQEEFIKHIEDFAEGYFRRKPFKNETELIFGIKEDLAEFVKERLDVVKANKLKVRPSLTPSSADYITVDLLQRSSWMIKDAAEAAEHLGFKPVNLLVSRLPVFTVEKKVKDSTVLFSIWILPENLTHEYIKAYTKEFQNLFHGRDRYNKYHNRFTMWLVHGNVTEAPLQKQIRGFGGLTCFKVEPGIYFGVGLKSGLTKSITSFYENMLFLPHITNKQVMISKLIDALEWLDKEAHRINFSCNYFEPISNE